MIRIGTRASKLARTQAEMVRAALAAHDPSLTFEIHAMTTAGDRELHKQLTDWGYKGLFTKELEDGLLSGSIDIAVHSMKDMPSLLPQGLMIAAMLPRAEIRDAWVSPHYESIEALPMGATVGTSSTRRAAQLLHWRPDLTIVPLRGNVETRLRKIAEGAASGTFLAAAGLQRLGLQAEIRSLIATERFLPAAAQGAVGVECAAARSDLRALLHAIDHPPTHACVTAERAMLLVLDGSCRTPIAGLAELEGTTLTLRGEILSLDGTIRHTATNRDAMQEAEQIGRALGQELRQRAGDALLSHGH